MMMRDRSPYPGASWATPVLGLYMTMDYPWYDTEFSGSGLFLGESRAPFNARWNLRSATEGIRSIRYNKGKLMAIKGRKYHDQGDGFFKNLSKIQKVAT